jgi:quercetin dioxygenase-like cupin family protein
VLKISRHDDIPGEQRGPGVIRKFTNDRSTGAGGITTGVVYLDPGGVIPPHTHLVEEAITLTEGRVRVLVGEETAEVDAGASFLAPGNTVHAVRNIGDSRAVLVIAFPSVEVAAFPADVEF